MMEPATLRITSFAVRASSPGIRNGLSRSYSTKPFSAQSRPSCTKMGESANQSPHSPRRRTFAAPIITGRRSFQTSASSSSQPKFNYHLSASYSAKDERYNPATHTFPFSYEAPILRKRAKKSTRPRSGQDAFFISSITTPQPSNIAFGVADGVGGWADSGVDPADFSHGFCDFMAWSAHNWSERSPKPLPGAQELMQIGYDSVLEDGDVEAGGSTACVGILKETGEVEVANLGDSGFLQLRLGKVHAMTEAQTHAFNTPFQLSVIPQKQRRQAEAFGRRQLMDYPKDSAVSKHEVQHGDIIVLASDGVWDNLSASDVLRIVSRMMTTCKAWAVSDDGMAVSPQLDSLCAVGQPLKGGLAPTLQNYLAVAIASEAKAASVNRKVDGPFAREVHRFYPEENWRGGKVDDICVVVAVAVKQGVEGLAAGPEKAKL